MYSDGVVQKCRVCGTRAPPEEPEELTVLPAEVVFRVVIADADVGDVTTKEAATTSPEAEATASPPAKMVPIAPAAVQAAPLNMLGTQFSLQQRCPVDAEILRQKAATGAAAEDDSVPSQGPTGNNVIHRQQWLIALELAERIRLIYGFDWSELYTRFKKVDFVIFTTNLCTVADQTLKRVEGRGVCEGVAEPSDRVIRYIAPRRPVGAVLPEFDDFKKRVLAQPSTLFVMVPDECHWGALKGSPHDRYVNDPELNQAENVVVLMVSATPYCTLTLDSRLQERYVSRDNQTDIFVHTASNGGRKFYVQQDADRAKCLSEVPEPDQKLVTDLHLISWQEVVKETSVVNPHRLTSNADVEWLQQAMPEEMREEEVHKYQSLGETLQSTHMSAKDEQLLRRDDGFEKLLNNSDFRNMDASRVLAVDYVFNLLLHLQHIEHFSDTMLEDVATCFLDAPYMFGKITKLYVQIVGGPSYRAYDPLTSRHVVTLIKQKCSSRHKSETRHIIERLLNPQEVAAQ